MRLLRIGEQGSRVADDIRAALTALGRGESLTGGIALIGVRLPESDQPVDAVLVLPRAVVLVLGVDLPGPAIHLDAPLHSEWQADGWSLVGTGSAINPGSAALETAEAIARRLHASGQVPVPICAILAVGPFAENVRVPDDPPASPVRVVHPRSSTLRSALDSFIAVNGVGLSRCTVEQARAIMRVIDPDVPIQPDTVLTHEGFLAGTAVAVHPTAIPAGQPARTAPVPLGLGIDNSTVPAAQAPQRRRGVARWWPLLAGFALLLAAVNVHLSTYAPSGVHMSTDAPTYSCLSSSTMSATEDLASPKSMLVLAS
ncbi:MAG: hypothetical protein ACRDQ7_28030 [Haloechinothrix sp.]